MPGQLAASEMRQPPCLVPYSPKRALETQNESGELQEMFKTVLLQMLEVEARAPTPSSIMRCSEPGDQIMS